MSNESNKQEVTVNEVSVHQVPADAQFIDVREREEYAAGHAIGTVNFPLSEFTDYVGQINTDHDVYVPPPIALPGALWLGRTLSFPCSANF